MRFGKLKVTILGVYELIYLNKTKELFTNVEFHEITTLTDLSVDNLDYFGCKRTRCSWAKITNGCHHNPVVSGNVLLNTKVCCFTHTKACAFVIRCTDRST